MASPKYRVNPAYVAFFCDERTKEHLQTVARLRRVSVSELLRALAKRADVLVWDTQLAAGKLPRDLPGKF